MRLIVNNDIPARERPQERPWRERQQRVNDEQALEDMRRSEPGLTEDPWTAHMRREISLLEKMTVWLLAFGTVGWLLFFYAATRGAVLTAAS